MVPGFNHNIKHKGRVFHIQTEDSGERNPHIITHLFVGGNILASKKTTYAEIVGQPQFEKTVRSMMEEQHKQMLRNLINGVYDTADTSNSYQLNGPAPLNTGEERRSAAPSSSEAPATEKMPPAPGPAPAPPPAAATAPVIDEKRVDTIFGEDLISEKSLDEVILSYLAEDLADMD